MSDTPLRDAESIPEPEPFALLAAFLPMLEVRSTKLLVVPRARLPTLPLALPTPSRS